VSDAAFVCLLVWNVCFLSAFVVAECFVHCTKCLSGACGFARSVRPLSPAAPCFGTWLAFAVLLVVLYSSLVVFLCICTVTGCTCTLSL